MKKILCLVLLLSGANAVNAQSRLFPKFIRRLIFEKDSSRRSSFIPLPVLSSAPETGIEAGLSGLYSFYTDTADRNTRVSNVFVYGTLTTKGQSRVNISTSYWLPKNAFHFTAGVGYINFPTNFYGIGSSTRKADAERIEQKRLRITLTGEKQFGKNIYLGFVSGAYNYQFKGADKSGIFETDPAVENPGGGAYVYLGPSFIFDNRNNNTYTTSGILLTSNYSFNKGMMSNNNYSGGVFSIEYSQYFSLSKHLVLGLDVYDNSLVGSQSPFYLMPALGSDELMRGYYNGRYRDRNYTAGQFELRYRINDRFGVVGFAGTGTVYHSTLDLNQLKPNYGGGFRYFFDVEKGLSVRLDYGIGEKRPGEERQSGFYIGLGEAF
ncbi:BamA/TamA family outer membrane protein [Mucilaginibacter paludis]|uniref:Surface antigen (D15) n=1 Tax=Mucilaginibacter paludis DSM 18603 TaxID=714943 RepID=H1Y1I5_9SPHI|nr:surface antigen (D15) [Mucilaginibacter paludis]EHQ30859.1 surface antigen (D15) [Mucilaginibacter paludis DSM 18603]